MTFQPAWWLPGPHAQTLWAALGRRVRLPPLRWEEVLLPDGDFVEIAWVDRSVLPDAPTVLVLHGLAGSVQSPHVAGLVEALAERGWRVGAFHFRGCGRRPNRSAVGYHSGKTDDPRAVLRLLRERHPGPLGVVGFSLGANVTLKMLGEDGSASVVDVAAAISPPLRLELCADRMQRGFSKVYQAKLVLELRRYVRAKIRAGVPIDPERLRGVWSFRSFDDAITAPLHGFTDSADYYARASSRPFLPSIRVPTLVVHALDDPFFTPEVLPQPHEVPAAVQLEVEPAGGHVGFVEGRLPLRGRYYVDTRVPAFFASRFASISAQAARVSGG
ncbi:MAG: hydrolase [Deltaproteobacteria bacterium]|nr:MAG: hydrolase [Deltaproteobacteria bacterium]